MKKLKMYLKNNDKLLMLLSFFLIICKYQNEK